VEEAEAAAEEEEEEEEEEEVGGQLQVTKCLFCYRFQLQYRNQFLKVNRRGGVWLQISIYITTTFPYEKGRIL
jgi:hypothetical protein